MSIRVVLVDDHTILRQGIRFLLELQGDMKVEGEAGDGEEAIHLVSTSKPDVVVLDLAMPGLDGVEVIKWCKEHYPEIKMLLLTQHENKEYVLSAIRAGADGYVLKRCAADELVNAIRQVFLGKRYLSAEIVEIVMEGLQDKEKTESEEEISEREKEVVILLAQGMTIKQAAKQLFISPKTVEFHRANIFRKMDFQNRADMLRFAIKKGWIAF